MFSFSDPFGIRRRKREEMERVIAPYVRPGDDELTKEAIHLALTTENFGRVGIGYCLFCEKLEMDRDEAEAMLLKLDERGIAPAIAVCKDLEFGKYGPQTVADLFKDDAGSVKPEPQTVADLFK